MAAISGKDGSVAIGNTAVLQITGWTFNHTSNNSAWASNNTAGYKNRVAGTKDSTGSFSAKYDGTIVPVVGDNMALNLIIAASENITLNAVVDNVDLSVDVDNGEVVGYTVAFSGNGPVTRT